MKKWRQSAMQAIRSASYGIPPEFLASLSEPLAQTGSAFSVNFENLQRFQQVPGKAVEVLIKEKVNSEISLEALLSKPGLARAMLDGNPSEYAAERSRIWNAKYGSDEQKEALAQRIADEDASIHGDDQFWNGVQLMEKLFVSHLWTVFESVSKDAWVAAVNHASASVKLSVFRHADDRDDPDGLSRKTIPVGLLAKHDFNLSGVLGSVLATRFDFTSFSGIVCAFSAISGGAQCVELERERAILTELETIRNVIVHRCGIVDDEFHRRLASRYKLGEPVCFETSQLEAYLKSVSLAAVSALRLSNQVISATKAR